MKQILVIESEFGEEDTFATEIGRELNGFADMKGKAQVVICEGGDGALDAIRNADEKDELFLLDTVSGTKDVAIIDDIKTLDEHGGEDSHDFDLIYLLQEMRDKEIKRKVRVIAVPGGGDAEAVATQVRNLVSQ